MAACCPPVGGPGPGGRGGAHDEGEPAAPPRVPLGVGGGGGSDGAAGVAACGCFWPLLEAWPIDDGGCTSRQGPPRPPWRKPRTQKALSAHWPAASGCAEAATGSSEAADRGPSGDSGDARSDAVSAGSSSWAKNALRSVFRSRRRSGSLAASGASFSGTKDMLRSTSHACRH